MFDKVLNTPLSLFFFHNLMNGDPFPLPGLDLQEIMSEIKVLQISRGIHSILIKSPKYFLSDVFPNI